MGTPLLLRVVVAALVLAGSALAAETRCSATTCRLPDCRCPGYGIPGGLKPEETPQIVLVTLDDAVNWDNWDLYLQLFPPEVPRKNPNGCPQAATFFISHNSTDYCMVQKLHTRRMEIADHSVTHRLPHAWWAEASVRQMQYEVLTQRHHLANLTGIPLADITGWRSPFLQPSGDHLFQVLHENGFTYDATLTYPFPRTLHSPVLWPFTLDFSYPLPCNIQPCPTHTYPGLWVVPVIVVMDYREHLPCAYIDHCTNEPRDQEETFEMLWKNFQRNYRTNRAPLYVNLHSRWLETDFHLAAMTDFLQRLSSMPDAYVLTIQQALAWVRDPTPLSAVHSFRPWQCPAFTPNQEERENCSFTVRTTKIPSTSSKPPSPPQPGQFYHTSHLGAMEDREENGALDHNGMPGDDGGTDGSSSVGGTATPASRVGKGKGQGHRRGHHRAGQHWFMSGGESVAKGGMMVMVVVSGVVWSGWLLLVGS